MKILQCFRIRKGKKKRQVNSYSSYYTGALKRRTGFFVAVGPTELETDERTIEGLGLSSGLIIPVGFLGLLAKFDYIPVCEVIRPESTASTRSW